MNNMNSVWILFANGHRSNSKVFSPRNGGCGGNRTVRRRTLEIFEVVSGGGLGWHGGVDKRVISQVTNISAVDCFLSAQNTLRQGFG